MAFIIPLICLFLADYNFYKKMIQAGIAKDESKRLQDLYSYDILDTFSEKDYDDITLMASIICEAPVALITFIDKDRQWFKSHRGTDVQGSPLEYAFCSYAIQTPGEAFTIEDFRKDDRFKDNPFVAGEPHIVFYAGVPLVTPNGQGLGTVCVLDVKPRVLTDQQIEALKILSAQTMNLLQLRKANNDLNKTKEQLELSLSSHIANRLKEVEIQNTELEKVNEELKAFNYISSHDLQEPLRKIQIFSSLIVEKESETLTAQAKLYIGKINNSASRMSALIKDLLSYSQVSAEGKVLEKIALSDLINDVKYDLQDEIENKNAQIVYSGNHEINVIPFQFRQLLYNLFSNSLKFLKEDTAPHIDVTSSYNTGSYFDNDKLDANCHYYCITICDNGIGFDNKYSEKIFELFQRLQTTDVQLGTGIGLTIVKKIVANHQGFIIANSFANCGATFTIYLPHLS